MKRRIARSSLIASLGVIALTGSLVLGADGGNPGSLGKTSLDVEVGWLVGSGQSDGEFITAQAQGVVIGLRAQERFVGPLEVSGARGDRLGVYQAATGTTGGDNNATWNYDFHVDLSGAWGNAKGKTLADYRLILEQDYTGQSLFGALGSDPVLLPFGPDGAGGVCDVFDVDSLCQQSWNPGFGNTDFDPLAEGSYTLRLVLTPETFNGPPVAVAVRVDVTD